MDKFDLIVCGAGVAGFCAAVAAARRGASVALVERQTTPGGILTYYGNCSIDEFNNPFRQDKKMVIAGIGWEYALRLWRAGYARIPDMNAEYVKHFQYGVRVNPAAAAKFMDDMLLEAGVHLFYGQPMVEALTEGRRITGIRIATRSGLQTLAADMFIDCTGDGELAAFAGAWTVTGDGEGVLQPGTLRYFPAVEPGEDRVLNFGDNRNHVPIDPTDSDAVTRAEIAARRMIFERMETGEERIMAIAPAVAPREGRRIRGESCMQVADYESGRQFADSICYTYWFVDVHREGQKALIRYIRHENTPSVRLSAMISADIENMMMAGRCISSDRETNSAIRVKSSCMAMGEAAGAAATMALRKKTDVRALDIAELKADLQAGGAIVPGLEAGREFSL